MSVPSIGLSGSLSFHKDFECPPGFLHEPNVTGDVAFLLIKRLARGQYSSNPRPFQAHGANQVQAIHQAGKTDIGKQKGHILGMQPQIIQGFFRAGCFYDLEVRLLKESCRQASDFEIVFDDQSYAIRLNPLSHPAISSVIRLQFLGFFACATTLETL
jgi:hypothetical protein